MRLVLVLIVAYAGPRVQAPRFLVPKPSLGTRNEERGTSVLASYFESRSRICLLSSAALATLA
jgi:hypothetical protein